MIAASGIGFAIGEQQVESPLEVRGMVQRHAVRGWQGADRREGANVLRVTAHVLCCQPGAVAERLQVELRVAQGTADGLDVLDGAAGGVLPEVRHGLESVAAVLHLGRRIHLIQVALQRNADTLERWAVQGTRAARAAEVHHDDVMPLAVSGALVQEELRTRGCRDPRAALEHEQGGGFGARVQRRDHGDIEVYLPAFRVSRILRYAESRTAEVVWASVVRAGDRDQAFG